MTIYDLGPVFGLTAKQKGVYDQLSNQLLDVVVPQLDTLSSKKKIIDVMYSIAYDIKYSNSLTKYSISSTAEYEKLKNEVYDRLFLYENFENCYKDVTQLEWPEFVAKPQPAKKKEVKEIPQDFVNAVTKAVAKKLNITLTPKEDLYLVSPVYPRITKELAINTVSPSGQPNQMYKSYPIIPTKQTEVSITTNVDQMTDRELISLYPTTFIRTRHPQMYERIEGCNYDDDLGLIIPVKGFNKNELFRNIVEYPHLYQIKRCIGTEYGKPVYEPFEKKIEIGGELHDTSEVWESLPDAKKLPNSRQYWKEYVIRRYLLERSHGIKHNYPIVGDLNPYLTLIGPPDYYKSIGFKQKDILFLAQCCVKSRVSFRASRNGVVQNKGVQDCVWAPYCFDIECSTVCPKRGQHSYLMNLNDLQFPLNFLSIDDNRLNEALRDLHSDKWFKCVEHIDPNNYAKLLTYLAICEQWEGSAANAVVYNLNFAKYAEEVTTSSPWAPSDKLEYMRIWSRGESCSKSGKPSTLIISGLDFVTLNDKLSSELMSIILDRDRPNFKTIVVTSKVDDLVGRDKMFLRLVEFLRGGLK